MSSSFLEDVQHFIEANGLLPSGARVLVGLSGGVDSVVLLHVLKRLGYEVAAAHVNYGLRGEASAGDEVFVRALCEQREIPCFVRQVEARAVADETGRSIQETARDLRFPFFLETIQAENVDFVALGHHRDDQAETVLLNLFRGSGLEGLAGMPARRPLAPGSGVVLVRPLLGVLRAEIKAFAEAEKLAWREDESNRSLAYRRSALREAVLPLLAEHFGEAVVENVARAAGHVRAYLDDAFSLGELFDTCRVKREVGGALNVQNVRVLPPVWRRRLILEALRRWLPGAPYRAALAEEIERLLEAQPGRRVEVKTGTVWRERGTLLFLPPGQATAETAHAVLPGETVELAQGSLRVDLVQKRPVDLSDGAPFAIIVDADRLRFPLALRPWQPGDVFRPFGGRGSRKVSDFLTDEKVPPHDKGARLVLLSKEEIVWVVGFRFGHAFRVRPETARFAKITFIPR